MSSRIVTFIGFGVIVAAAAVWQVVALVTPNRATIGHIQRWLMQSVWVRVVLFAFWAWLGLHLFARGSG
jgi:hypothetical protein